MIPRPYRIPPGIDPRRARREHLDERFKLPLLHDRPAVARLANERRRARLLLEIEHAGLECFDTLFRLGRFVERVLVRGVGRRAAVGHHDHLEFVDPGGTGES